MSTETLQICFFFFERDGQWFVEFDHEPFRLQFPTLEAAREAARNGAEARWLLTGMPSCVRLGSPNGESSVDAHYPGS